MLDLLDISIFGKVVVSAFAVGTKALQIILLRVTIISDNYLAYEPYGFGIQKTPPHVDEEHKPTFVVILIRTVPIGLYI